MNIPLLSTTVGLIALIGGGGYTLATKLEAKADKPTVVAVDAKTDYLLDKQMEGTLSQINRLEAKPKKTQDDREQIRYLREELERSREIRKQR